MIVMIYTPPHEVSIPTPSEIPKGYGPNSTGKRGGNLRIRCTNAEYDMLQQEATALGISLANFCRWCSVHVAQELEKHRSELPTIDTIGDNNGEDKF